MSRAELEREKAGCGCILIRYGYQDYPSQTESVCNMIDAAPWVAIAVSVASVFFTGFAWRTTHQKLRLDLYNKRFDVYSRTLDFYHALSEWGRPTDSEMASTSLQDSPELRAAQKAFIKASREAGFLFDKDSGIQKRLEQMHYDTMGVIGYKRHLGPKLVGPALISATAEFAECLKRITNASPTLEQMMMEYLDFRVIGRAGFVNRRLRHFWARNRIATKKKQ